MVIYHENFNQKNLDLSKNSNFVWNFWRLFGNMREFFVLVGLLKYEKNEF
jgi:hypothetical protein